jgi:hypothetical protein
MDLLKAFRAYLVITLGWTQAQAEAKVPDGTEDFTTIMGDVTNAHKAKVNTQTEETLTQGYNKGKKESLEKFEGEVRTKFGVTSTKKGLELVEEIISEKTPDPTNPDTIPADTIKKHPAFREREKDLSDQLKAAKDETEAKVNEVKNSYAQKENFAKVGSEFLKKFRALNPVLPADAEKAARQEARLIKDLEASGLVFEFQEGIEEPLIMERLPDGTTKRKEDGHRNAIKFDDLVRSTAEDAGFEFKAGEERSAPGGNNPGTTPPNNQTGAKKYTGAFPTTEAEYTKIITDSSIPLDQRGEVQDAWEAKNKPPTS